MAPAGNKSLRLSQASHVKYKYLPTYPISNQAIGLAKFKYPHLKDLPLADSENGNKDLEVEITVGANYLWNFMLDHVVQGSQV